MILDCRPFDEFPRVTIPTAINVPGAELVLRVQRHGAHAGDAGGGELRRPHAQHHRRQSLINAGFPNHVVALKDGTMGWELAGLKVATGETVSVAAPEGDGLIKARAAAEKLKQRFGVKHIDEAKLEQFRKESDQRTLYIFDVREPAEYEAGHRPGVRLPRRATGAGHRPLCRNAGRANRTDGRPRRCAPS